MLFNYSIGLFMFSNKNKSAYFIKKAMAKWPVFRPKPVVKPVAPKPVVPVKPPIKPVVPVKPPVKPIVRPVKPIVPVKPPVKPVAPVKPISPTRPTTPGGIARPVETKRPPMPWPNINFNIDPVALATLIISLGGILNTDGSASLPDGSLIDAGKNLLKAPDGVIHHQDGRVEFPDGRIIWADNTIEYPDGRIVWEDGTEQLPDGSTRYPDGLAYDAQGNLVSP
ncbi:hypothetical protein ACIQVE_01445 [Pseudomonas sp. NPDC098747]|uniref:hypothetical protein n=1 Tax=Pseudomonas sp. NPDC098747 TaxID=3364487 RepID=UPI00383A644B